VALEIFLLMSNKLQPLDVDEKHFQYLFEYAPVSLWVEDFIALKTMLDNLRSQNVNNLREYLVQNPILAKNWISKIQVVNVNRKTLEQFGAKSKEELINNLDQIFREDIQDFFQQELLFIWDGKTEFECEGVNYTLDGKRLEINLKWAALPGYEHSLERVLITIENLTERNQANRALEKSEQHFRGLFENSPVSLWEEDFSEVKKCLNHLREEGITSLKDYLEENPSMVEDCMAKIKVTDVNRKTLELYRAKSKNELVSNINLIFRDEMRSIFREELLDIWEGKLQFEREGDRKSVV
jgi:PAS domain-containing protein